MTVMQTWTWLQLLFVHCRILICSNGKLFNDAVDELTGVTDWVVDIENERCLQELLI